MKTLDNAFAATSRYCIARSDISAMKYVVSEHFTDTFSMNNL